MSTAWTPPAHFSAPWSLRNGDACVVVDSAAAYVANAATPDIAQLMACAPEIAESLAATLALLRKAQDVLSLYLQPDGFDDLECCNRLLELLDGPEQRAVETPARALLGRLPVAS